MKTESVVLDRQKSLEDYLQVMSLLYLGRELKEIQDDLERRKKQ